MAAIKEISAECFRDYIDMCNIYEYFLEVKKKARQSFSGSMKFEFRGKHEYLLYRPFRSSSHRSLGRRSPATEKTYQKFTEGKADCKERINSLKTKIARLAPRIKYYRLGRVPNLTARIIRKFDELNLLGKSLFVVGTNAIYGFEMKACVQIHSETLKAGDLDILFDAQKNLTFTGNVSKPAFIGILQAIDKSFAKLSPKECSAVNKDGFVVNLREPQDHQQFMVHGQTQTTDGERDQIAISTDSSKWLVNTPKFEAIAFDKSGFPLKIVTLDPRVFALQKLWIAKYDETRLRPQSTRDLIQAQIVANIAVNQMGLDFDSNDLTGLPNSVRSLATEFDLTPSISPPENPL